MATKIFYNDNRIIIDGHADTPQECQAITAMCDEMANSENFKTIVYEQGHAVFEQISGGDSSLFLELPNSCKCDLTEYLKSEEAKGIYLTQTNAASIYATKTHLTDAINELLSMIGDDDQYRPPLQEQIDDLTSTVNAIRDSFAQDLGGLFENFLALESKATKTLPYTAEELVAKLESI